MSSVKHQLYLLCNRSIEERIRTLQEAIRHAQLSANEETKSSAGDKYETARAMAQLEIEKNSIQLAEARKLKQVLDQISPDTNTATVQTGSLVITNEGNFYIAVSAGQFSYHEHVYHFISPASPLAQHLMGQKIHNQVNFKGRNFRILQIL